MGCCGSSSASQVAQPRPCSYTPGENIGGAVTLPVLHPVHGAMAERDMCSTHPAHSTKEQLQTQVLARGMPATMPSRAGAPSEVGTPLATPKSYDTLTFQECVFMDFTEEEKHRDRVEWNDDRKEFMRWSSEEQAWEQLCTTPKYMTAQSFKSARTSTPKTVGLTQSNCSIGAGKAEANVWIPTWMSGLAKTWTSFER